MDEICRGCKYVEIQPAGMRTFESGDREYHPETWLCHWQMSHVPACMAEVIETDPYQEECACFTEKEGEKK